MGSVWEERPVSARQRGLTATRWGGLRRTVAGVALTALAVGGLSAITLIAPRSADAATSASQQFWTSLTPGATSGAGQTMTGTFGSTGVTAAVRVAAGNTVASWPQAQGSIAVASGTQNVAASLEPDPPANSVSIAQALQQPGSGIGEVITFNKPVLNPILHVVNLDGSYIDIAGNTTAGAAITTSVIASNGDLERSGNRYNNAPVAANNQGCSTSEGCGSIQLNGLIKSFSLNNTAAVAGDGWVWALSFPTAPLTKQFTPGAINPGGTSQLTFTIANPANSAQPTLTPLDFTDKLPAGVTLKDDTFTNNGNCGTPTSSGVTAGSDTVTAGNITVAAGATCTITVNVTASEQGTYTNDNSNLSTTVANLVPNANTSLTVTTAEIPTVTCTSDPVIFNTGYNQATDGQLPNGAADPRWTVAGGYTGLNYVNTTVFPAGPSAAELPPAGTAYEPAQAGKVNNLWSNSQSGKSQWISARYVDPSNGQNQADGYGDWYYRYQFNLDPQVDPSTFQLDMSWLSDNTVAGVWVNNVAQEGDNLPQDPDNAWGGGGFNSGNAAKTSMAGDWKTGLNTILVQVKSFYTAEGFNAEVTSTALCPDPTLTIKKTAENTTSEDNSAPLKVGDVVKYTVTATNDTKVAFTDENPVRVTDDMSDVIDDATLDEDSLTATVGGQTVDAPTFDSPNLAWSGPLDPGETVTITYTVTYTGAGNSVLVNNACVPEGTETDGTQPCASTTLPAPKIVPWKTAEASSDPLAAGSTITYTLHFENTGTTTGPVDKVDNLSKVLDDATVTVEPSAEAPLTATRNGDTITVGGNLAAGETRIVTYTVTLKADGQRGDNILANYVLDPGDQPPGDPVCIPKNEERPDCTINKVPELVPSKTVDPEDGSTVTAGQVLTYTLTFDNSKGAEAATVRGYSDDLSEVLDDATVTTQPTASIDSLEVGAIEDGSFPVTGTVPAGKIGTVTYEVTVKADGERGDNTLDNSLVRPDGPPVETHNPVSWIVPSKTVDPESGSTVKAGQVLTYTLTFTNRGEGKGTVNYVDDMTKVLDDATVTKDPTVSDPALNVASTKAGYAITGTLTAGQTATVTYQVTVKPDGKRGDNKLGNALADPDRPNDPPIVTENPVPEITHAKTVDPTSTTPVVPGQVLTYTLTYKNTGAAAGTVDEVDDITQAVDDATVTKQPTVKGGNLEATEFGSDNRSHITGSLPAGATVTVTYQLTVKAADELGDGVVANFLLKPGDPPPSSPECEPTSEQNPDCTVNPVGKLKVSKIVDPKTGTTVSPGDTLHFTLSFENVGKGAIPVDYVDDMTGVLDDATVTTQPVASNQALTVTKVTDGTVGITGSLQGGQKVIVTYAVTTKPWAQQGDHVMENYLDPVGDIREPRCVSTDPLCTRNPIAEPPVTPVTPPGLAFTGTELVGPGIALALMLLALGGGLLVVRRRRQDGDVQDNA